MTIFLIGDLKEKIYINEPERFITKVKEKKACKLVRFLCGLKQAPKQWHQKFSKVIAHFRFTNEHDKFIYSKVINNDYIILCLYADVIFIFGTSLEVILKVKDYLPQNFDMKDMRPTDMILGRNFLKSISKHRENAIKI